ncbi:MAG: hypothetical protein ACRELT_05085, partial [Longimicrobiales bacterium]
ARPAGVGRGRGVRSSRCGSARAWACRRECADNPLEYSTRVEQAYIEGRRIDMMDSHKRFFEKYMERLRHASSASDLTC